MTARSFVIALAAALVAAPVGAQTINSQCPAGAPGSNDAYTQDICQKAIDLFQFTAPQLGLSLTGGNAQLGPAGTLGGLGHFSFGIRANVVNGALPQFNAFDANTTGAQQDTITTKSQAIPMPTVEAGIGLFKGLPLGITRVGSVDALVSVAYLPERESEEMNFRTPDGSFNFGYGARVGILGGSPLWPAVSFTYLRRQLPTIGVETSTGSGRDSIKINDFNVETSAWRLVASKGFGMLGLAAGVGQDTYDTNGQLDVTVRDVTTCPTTCQKTMDFGQKVTRANYFADMYLNLPVVKIVGEIGMASGGDIGTYNQFKDRNADDSLLYGSIGLRFGLGMPNVPLVPGI